MENKNYQKQINELLDSGYVISVETSSGTTLYKPVGYAFGIIEYIIIMAICLFIVFGIGWEGNFLLSLLLIITSVDGYLIKKSDIKFVSKFKS